LHMDRKIKKGIKAKSLNKQMKKLRQFASSKS